VSLTPGFLFTNPTFIEMAMQTFLEKHPGSESPVQFQCSPGFIQDFKTRNRFSSPRAHLKRRPSVRDDDRADWLTTLVQLLRDIPDHERIINIDESCWRVHPDGLQTWAATESENIRPHRQSNAKDAFTIVPAITAARTKLPLTLSDCLRKN
jgi:hypothetical protein